MRFRKKFKPLATRFSLHLNFLYWRTIVNSNLAAFRIQLVSKNQNSFSRKSRFSVFLIQFRSFFIYYEFLVGLGCRYPHSVLINDVVLNPVPPQISGPVQSPSLQFRSPCFLHLIFHLSYLVQPNSIVALLQL